MPNLEDLHRSMFGGLTLRKKILFLMVVVMSGLIITTLLIVNLFTKAELDKTLQKDLKRTQTLFENYQSVRTNEISVENKLIGEVPFLKALLSTRDTATILGFAKSFQEQIGSDLFIITDGEGNILASTDPSRSQGNLMGEHSINIAMGGEEANGVFCYPQCPVSGQLSPGRCRGFYSWNDYHWLQN